MQLACMRLPGAGGTAGGGTPCSDCGPTAGAQAPWRSHRTCYGWTEQGLAAALQAAPSWPARAAAAGQQVARTAAVPGAAAQQPPCLPKHAPRAEAVPAGQAGAAVPGARATGRTSRPRPLRQAAWRSQLAGWLAGAGEAESRPLEGERCQGRCRRARWQSELGRAVASGVRSAGCWAVRAALAAARWSPWAGRRIQELFAEGRRVSRTPGTQTATPSSRQASPHLEGMGTRLAAAKGLTLLPSLLVCKPLAVTTGGSCLGAAGPPTPELLPSWGCRGCWVGWPRGGVCAALADPAPGPFSTACCSSPPPAEGRAPAGSLLKKSSSASAGSLAGALLAGCCTSDGALGESKNESSSASGAAAAGRACQTAGLPGCGAVRGGACVAALPAPKLGAAPKVGLAATAVA